MTDHDGHGDEPHGGVDLEDAPFGAIRDRFPKVDLLEPEDARGDGEQGPLEGVQPQADRLLVGAARHYRVLKPPERGMC